MSGHTSIPLAADISASGWWKAGIKSSKGGIIYNGINADGSFNTIFPIWSDVRAKPLAVVLVTYDLAKIINKMNYKVADEKEAVLIQTTKETFFLGSESVVARFRDPIIKHIEETFKEVGWYNGGRYELQVLKKPAAFKQQLRVTAIREEPFVPQDSVIRISVAASIGFLTWVILQFFAGIAAKKIIAGNSETLAAGDILLRRLRSAGDTSGFHKYKDQTHLNVEDEFKTYLKTYKETVLENVESHEYELKRDMELATEFQMAYVNRPYPSVPKNITPNRLKLNFHHCYEPALALGGDFFDIYNVTPEVGGVFIADVMGHGARSALITATLRAMLSDLLPQGRNARNVMTEMNKSFYSLLESVNAAHPIFASAFYFVGDMTARAATFSTAGHPAPYHIHRKGNVIHRLQVQEPHGAALGISPNEEYTGGSCRLVDGDVFIFFTDGIYEAFNSMGEEFGLQRMEKALNGLLHKNCQEIVDGLVSAVKEFAGDEPLHDDICVVGVEVAEGR